VSDIFSHALDLDRDPWTLASELDDGSLARLEIDWSRLSETLHGIETEFDSYDTLLPA
jgi:hypothetical protein